MSTRPTLHHLMVLILLIGLLIFFATSPPSVAQDNTTLLQQNRTPTATITPTPKSIRVGRAVAITGGPVIFDFPTPKPVDMQGPIAGAELTTLQKNRMAVVKLTSCRDVVIESCSEGTGVIIHPKGLILTALHVINEIPNDPPSSITSIIRVGVLPSPYKAAIDTYKASVVATAPGLDLALLQIIRTSDGPDLFLPTLPIEAIDVTQIEKSDLRVMGFPKGQDLLQHPQVNFTGINEDDEWLMEQSLTVIPGFSGGPLLVESGDHTYVGGVTFYKTDASVLVQPIERIKNLAWRIPRTWLQDIHIQPNIVEGLIEVKFTANLHAIDLVGQQLRLEAVAYDMDRNEPWPSSTSPLTIRKTVVPTRFIDAVSLELSESLIEYDVVPDRLRFRLRLRDESSIPWSEDIVYVHPFPTNDPQKVFNITDIIELLPNEYLRLGRGSISEIAYAPDSNTLATATSIGVWLYRLDQTDNGRLLTHANWIRSISWSLDGRLALAADDNTITIWDAENGQTLHKLLGHTGKINSVRWSANGHQLASASDDMTVRIWDADSGQNLHILSGHTSPIMSISWSLDGSQLASGSVDKTVRIWNTTDGTGLRILQGHEGPVLSVSWSPNGTQLASASDDRTIRIWDTDKGQNLHILTEHTDQVSSVSWSPNGTQLASASWDNTVRIWDADSGQNLRILQGHVDWVDSVSWSPDGKTLASASADGTVRIWAADKDQNLRILAGHSRNVTGVSWSPNGMKLASASSDKTISVWDAESGQNLYLLQGHTGSVNSVSWSLDSTHLASASYDQTVHIWDADNGQDLRTLSGHKGKITSVTWSPTNNNLASASFDKTVRIWDAESGKTLRTLSGHRDWVNGVDWSPDSSRLASASWDKTIIIWDVQSGLPLRTLIGHSESVNSVRWSPDGSRLASASSDNSVRIWDTNSGQNTWTFLGHTSPVVGVGWSQDGSQLASASEDKTVNIWDTNSGKNLLTLLGHTSNVTDLSWAPKDNQLITCSDDGTVRMWKVVMPKLEGDFSTPRSVVQTFIDAATSHNLDLLSQVFSNDAGPEFDSLIKKEASQEDITSLAMRLQGAVISRTEVERDQIHAIVYITSQAINPIERILVVKTSAGWKIVDFTG